jgi:hemoglobin/transferrin/lactoferrin receptor protein
MKRYLLFLLMSICCKIGTAQTISVKDNVSLTPIQGVIVRVGGNEIYSTDKNGIANINNLKINETIELSCIGYSKKITNLAEITKNNFVVYLSERAYNTNEVVISANRFEESSEKLPQHIAVLKAKSIEKSNVQTTADLIQNTGLVNVQKSQAGGGSPMIRGFEANKVLMVVDGVRMNNAIYRGGHLQNVISMDQSSLERM